MGELDDLVRPYLDDPEEGPLLARVLADPGDEDARAEYKRFLGQKGDPRADLVSGKIPFSDQAALLRVARIVDRPEVIAWLAFLEPRARIAPIRNCGLGMDWGEERFQFECPRTWDSLATTSDPKIRSCDECKREVFFCDDDEELVANAAKGRCVAMNAPAEAWLARRAANERRFSYTGRPRPVDHLAAFVRKRQS